MNDTGYTDSGDETREPPPDLVLMHTVEGLSYWQRRLPSPAPQPARSEPTPQERAAWAAACEAATPGPWRLTWDSQELRLHPAGVWEPAIAEWGYAVSPWRPETYDEVDRRDADFMVIARDALPRLLAALTACEAKATKWEMEYQMMERTAAVIEAREQAARDEAAGYRAELARVRAELAAEADMRAGRVTVYPTMEALLADLPATQAPLLAPDVEQLGLLP